MTGRTRVVDGETLEPILGYRWDLYLISTDSEAAYASGLGYWTVAYVDPTTLTVSYVERTLSIGDALTVAKIHKAGRS